MTGRHEEWHVTVTGDPMDWYRSCGEMDIKPLYIELSNGALQLMCAARDDPSPLIDDLGRFKIVRVKREVSTLLPGETALYWEAHYKIDGPWMRLGGAPVEDWHLGVSRDLYRRERSYVTRRLPEPFEAESGMAADYIRLCCGPTRRLVGIEYEACVLDTNPALDECWL